MDDARRIMCDCGKLLCKVQNGEIVVYCVRCKHETAIPITKQFTRITKPMNEKYGCSYCQDRLAMYCPHGECAYKEKLKPFESYEDFFRTKETSEERA
jgi:hypothetical protein